MGVTNFKVMSGNIKNLDNNYEGWRDNPILIFKYGTLDLVKTAVTELNYKRWDIIAKATSNLDTLTWVSGKGNVWKWVLKSSVKNNFTFLFTVALQHYNYWPKISFYIGQYNNQGLIEQYKNSTLNGEELVVGAAKGGHTSVLFIITDPILPNWKKIIKYAAIGGFMDIIELGSREYGFPWQCIAEGSARGGHIGLLYLAVQNHQVDWIAIGKSAARTNRLIPLIVSNIDWNSENAIDIVYGAARGGHINLLLYIVTTHGLFPDWNKVAFKFAKGGHLELINFIRMFGKIEWDKISSKALEHGYLITEDLIGI
jgi:hypothetical protein